MPFTSASALGFPSKSCAEIAPDHRESSRRIFGARFEDNAQTRINIAACLHSWYFHGALENGGNRFPLPAPRSRAWFILGGQVQGRTSPCLFKCPLPARLHSASSSEHNRFARPKIPRTIFGLAAAAQLLAQLSPRLRELVTHFKVDSAPREVVISATVRKTISVVQASDTGFISLSVEVRAGKLRLIDSRSLRFSLGQLVPTL